MDGKIVRISWFISVMLKIGCKVSDVFMKNSGGILFKQMFFIIHFVNSILH